jgi:hypothetical protein
MGVSFCTHDRDDKFMLKFAGRAVVRDLDVGEKMLLANNEHW